jgi:hypothetical protein
MGVKRTVGVLAGAGLLVAASSACAKDPVVLSKILEVCVRSSSGLSNAVIPGDRDLSN